MFFDVEFFVGWQQAFFKFGRERRWFHAKVFDAER
jgi:hypothetical protein